MSNLYTSRYSLLNWFLSNKSELLLKEGIHRIEFFALLISNLFKELILEEQNKKQYLLPTKSFEINNFSNIKIKKYFDMIRNHILEIEDLIELFSIHGSYADSTYKIGWSDVDTFLIIKSSSCKNPKSLLKIREKCLIIENLFYRICPLQHHGVIAIGKSDLEFYDSHFLPIKVVESSKHIIRNSDNIFYFQNHKASGAYHSLLDRYNYLLSAEEKGFYMHHPYKGIGLPINHSKLDEHMYQLFCFLGYLMTTPAYFLDAIGKPTTKKDSFLKIYNYLSDNQLEIIKVASKIRHKWSLKEGNEYKLNKIPSWVLEILPFDYFKKTKSLIKLLLNLIDKNKLDKQ